MPVGTEFFQKEIKGPVGRPCPCDPKIIPIWGVYPTWVGVVSVPANLPFRQRTSASSIGYIAFDGSPTGEHATAIPVHLVGCRVEPKTRASNGHTQIARVNKTDVLRALDCCLVRNEWFHRPYDLINPRFPRKLRKTSGSLLSVFFIFREQQMPLSSGSA